MNEMKPNITQEADEQMHSDVPMQRKVHETRPELV